MYYRLSLDLALVVIECLKVIKDDVSLLWDLVWWNNRHKVLIQARIIVRDGERTDNY